jgi:hypothetical protein
MSRNVLVRYGTIAEVARFGFGRDFARGRGERVVVRTHRGIEVGTLLEDLQPSVDHPGGKSPADGHTRALDDPAEGDDVSDFWIVRAATPEDEGTARRLQLECEREFSAWRNRIDQWKLGLELIDLEWTLDKSKLILYVLNDRGPECTKLALQAAAAGLGTVEVQPVGPDGPVAQKSAGGCGSGHCGSGGDSHGCCG